MARPCSVCIHPKVNEINRLLIRRAASYRELGVQWDLSKAAMYRHRAEHIPERLSRATEVREQLATDDLLGQARTIQEQAFNLLADATKQSAPTMGADGKMTAGTLLTPGLAARALREAREGVRLLGEVLGKLTPVGSPIAGATATATVVIYEVPDNGRGPGAREAALAKFNAGLLGPGDQNGTNGSNGSNGRGA